MPFVNSALLWGMGLVSLPIIIHLLNRRRFKIVRWAAMEYLLAANRRNRRRVRLEHLIVLLLRCLAIALIVLAVARPVSTSGALLFLPGARDPVERIVVIDDSGSMGYQVGRASSFERARRLVGRMVDDLRQGRSGDYLTVFRSSRLEPDLLLSSLNDPRVDELVRGLGEAEPTDRTFDVPGVLDHVLAQVGANEDAPAQKVVYVLTDLRRRDWVGAEGLAPRAIGEVVAAAPPEVRFLVVDVGHPETQNLGVTAVRPAEKLAMAGVPYELVVEVSNRGDADVFDVPLVLETGATRVPLAPVERIPAGEAAEVRHRYTFMEPGVHAATVRLPDDPLGLDNARHLAIDVQEGLSVLLVDGEEGTGPLRDETDLLELALAPPGDTTTGIDPVVVDEHTVAEEDLSAFQSVVLCNLEGWPPERVEQLERFVARGGGLGVFVGDRVDVEAWNRDLYAEGEGLLPLPLARREEAPTDDAAPGLSPPPESAQHPLAKVFLGDRNPFLRRVRGRVRLMLDHDRERDPTSEVILHFADPVRTPFLVERPFGRGRTVLFNTTADREWSSWPRDPSYPITAQELVRLLAPASTAGRNLATGDALERSINPARYETRAVLRVPGDEAPRELLGERREGSGSLWLSFDDTGAAGVYALELFEREAGEPVVERYAVNLDPSEGDTAPADPAQVMPALDPERVRFEALPGEDASLLTLSDGTRSELWRTCLIALLVVMALEQLFAWRAAHHAAEPAALEAAS